MALSLRDLLTGNVPGNALQNIPLDLAADPQLNHFSYNIIAGLGPTPGVNTGASKLFDKQGGMVNLSTGAPFPSNGVAGAGGAIPAPSQGSPALPKPQLFAPGNSIMHQWGEPRSQTVFAPGQSVMTTGGEGLKRAMTAWKAPTGFPQGVGGLSW